jgi:hypothetical protein
MDKAVGHPETDVVVIALPNHLHEAAVAACALHRKAVLCTKPLGRTAAEALRMLRMVEESPVPLAALWVFDLPSQNADYNITADNARSYQLREVAEANARVQKGRTVRQQK